MNCQEEIRIDISRAFQICVDCSQAAGACKKRTVKVVDPGKICEWFDKEYFDC